MNDKYHSALIELRDLLVSVKERFWVKGVQEFLDEFEQLESNNAAPSRFSEHYRKVAGQIAGGMGSLTDLNFTMPGGHFGSEETLRLANRKKRELVHVLYEEAKARQKALSLE